MIVRGIEHRDIFNDDHDRQMFMERFSRLLSETGVHCYAWALLSNHFHLLLMPTSTPLSFFMRRLLTGYAVSFNRRHKRSGHLFQNRYKSTVCEEEPYLLELIRYIHLNPLRAGMVANLEGLNQYEWTGHAVLMGNRRLDAQNADVILERFGKNSEAARQNYSLFISEGIAAGHRDDLVGGGLKRSQGERPDNKYESCDERILGCGDFVDTLKLGTDLCSRMKSAISLVQLLTIVATALDLDSDSVRKPGKKRIMATARGIICHLAIFELGYTGVEVGALLHLKASGVSLASRRGEKALKADPGLMEGISIQLAK